MTKAFSENEAKTPRFHGQNTLYQIDPGSGSLEWGVALNHPEDFPSKTIHGDHPVQETSI